MLNADILNAVYGYLAAQSGLPDIKYHDDTSIRTGDYITPRWMPAKTMSPVISNDGHIEQRGMFQIDCLVKARPGAELVAAQYADDIAALFPRTLVLDKLQVTSAASVAPIRTDGGYEARAVWFEYTIVDAA